MGTGDWWWNGEVQGKEAKKHAYVKLVDSKDDEEKRTNREKYKMARKEAKLAVSAAKTEAFERIELSGVILTRAHCILSSSGPASSTTNVPAQTKVRKRGFHNPICCKCNKRHQGVCRYGADVLVGVEKDMQECVGWVRMCVIIVVSKATCKKNAMIKYNSNTKNGGVIRSPALCIANSTTPFAARSTRTLADQGNDRDGVLGLSGDQARYHDMTLSRNGPVPDGVICFNDRVNGLNITNANVNGTLYNFPFSSLPFLEYVDLSLNQLSGTIPPKIEKLNNLVDLDLSMNNLSRSIPITVGDLIELKILYRYSNQLSGPISSELGNLKNLSDLELSHNQLTGSIPITLGDLTELQILYFHSNQLSGPIPSELGNLKKLSDLELSHNQLTGSIPITLGDLTELQILFLHSNQLSGPIPSELGNLKNLIDLGLSSNKLSGSIPITLGDLTELKILYLHFNQLTGPIPSELGNLKNLTKLDLSNNQLTGSIPFTLGDLTELKLLHLFSNQFSGPIPRELGNLKNLTKLDLSDNQLTGTIPFTLGDLTELKILHLFYNQFSGPIPSELANLKNLMN
ncbi:probable leucine-rich repeat receptor-like protein kinase At1g35710 [Lycium ferocissimum]|uniref:probable leucine-rich repeat receptor-like protein kinase At1g35710 n=1 Tax=Lycium ferocissimum TaxID=112874 RepID=UPI002814CC0B|nr:probable leucine-rich repeat receptor-like protein kinase At1g35710 [Lycium ferocissimum]